VDSRSPQPSRDHALAAAFLLLLVFVTPAVHLWASGAFAWYLPYLLWLVVLFPLLAGRLAAGLRKRRR
jgi:hypothetical protein